MTAAKLVGATGAIHEPFLSANCANRTIPEIVQSRMSLKGADAEGEERHLTLHRSAEPTLQEVQ